MSLDFEASKSDVPRWLKVLMVGSTIVWLGLMLLLWRALIRWLA